MTTNFMKKKFHFQTQALNEFKLCNLNLNC